MIRFLESSLDRDAFELRVADGIVTNDDIAFLSSDKSIWAKGVYYAGEVDLSEYVKKDDITNVHVGTPSLIMEFGIDSSGNYDDSTLTLTIPTINNTTVSAKAILPLVEADGIPGLMTPTDKAKLDDLSNYTLPLATASVRGGVKIGYTANDKNYPVQLSNEQMYVNVPWTDTNTTYTAGAGLSITEDGVLSVDLHEATASESGLMSAEDKSKLDQIKDYISDTIHSDSEFISLYAYGVEWDVTVADPTLTRIGNSLLHKSLPIQSQLRGCVAQGDLIMYYLDADDWSLKEDGTASRLDGYDGTVKVHTPKFYGKSEIEGNKRRVWISLKQIDESWEEIPEMLIDAYRSTVLNTVPEDMGYLSTLPINSAVSIVNDSTYCRGGQNSTTYDQYLSSDPYRCLLNKPRTNIRRSLMRQYARNVGQEMLSYEQYKWIFYWLYVIEYANFNSQAAYNEELTSDGYRQGGLGAGITSVNYGYWRYYNNNNPLTPCGYCNDLGNGTGVKTMTVIMPTVSGGDPAQTYTFSVPRWRGFDNPFGDIWTNLDGVLIDTPLAGATDTDVLPTCYVIKDSQDYTDSLTDIENISNLRTSLLPHENGYIKEFNIGASADIIPSSVGGNATSYKCDYYWMNYDDTPETLLVGGRANIGSLAGLGYFHAGSAVGHASAYVGFRCVKTI